MKRLLNKAPLLAAGLLLAAVGTGALAGDPKPDAGLAEIQAKLPGPLINDPRALVDFQNYGTAATSKVVKSSGIPGGAALQVHVPAAGDGWKVTASTGLSAPIARGDIVTVGFYARALPRPEGGADARAQGSLALRVQQSAEPWPGFLDRTVDIGPEWGWHEVSGLASVPMAKGGGSIILQLGGRAQAIEIAQMIAIKGASSIASPTGAAGRSDLPPSLAAIDGTLLNDPAVAGGRGAFGPAGSVTMIDDTGVFGAKATRFTIDHPHQGAWEVGMGVPLKEPIAVGDLLTTVIAIRTVSAKAADGKGQVGFRFQSSRPPYAGFADNTFSPGPTWQLIRIRTTATQALAQGEATFGLQLAGAEQVIDVGPIYVFKMKQP